MSQQKERRIVVWGDPAQRAKQDFEGLDLRATGEKREQNSKVSWIHVYDDGCEIRYADPPESQRALRVVAISDEVEEAITNNFGILKRHHFSLPVVPRGVGWRMHDASDDRTTTWRRARSWMKSS